MWRVQLGGLTNTHLFRLCAEPHAAQIDPDKLGLKLRAFVEITLTSQSREAMGRFEQAVADFDDILQCHLMSGNADYILRTAARDVEELGQIHRSCLSRLPEVPSMRSSFAIRTIKGWRGFVLP
jgi:Lrp/AsnC family leucine-responsive transcriptional regulator